MKSQNESAYRLNLAKGYLAKAEGNAMDEQWDDCLADAQEAVENAGKAILSRFQPIAKTHDVIKPITELLRNDEIPPEIREQIRERLDVFEDMGFATHVRATYGDEAAQIPPWDLISETEALHGLNKARGAVALAESLNKE